jgi:membrane AbrB-like protein
VPIIIAAGAVGAVVCRLLKSPAPYLFGAFLGSAVVHGAGLVTAPVPPAILIPSFVVLGAFIALRFKGTTWASLKDDLAASVAALVVGTVVAGIGAYLVHAAFGIGLAEAMVAFAPGGLEAMIIIALALKLDVAYVSLHHLIRFLGIAVTLPLIVRLVIGRKAPPAGT